MSHEPRTHSQATCATNTAAAQDTHATRATRTHTSHLSPYGQPAHATRDLPLGPLTLRKVTSPPVYTRSHTFPWCPFSLLRTGHKGQSHN